MTSTRRLSWALAIAIASTLCSAGCRQLAGYTSSSPDLPDAGRVEGGVPEAGPPEAGWPEVGPPDGPGPLPPDDPAPPLLDVIQRPPYAVTVDKVGQRLPLFRDGTDYRTVESIYGSDLLGWWIVGEVGWIAHNPGDGFRRVFEPVIKNKDYKAVWATSPADVWISGDTNTGVGTQVLHFAGGGSFEPPKLDPTFTKPVTGIRGHGSDVWFSTDATGQLLRWDGAKLSTVSTGQGEVHRRPWIDDSGVLWFATKGGVGRFDGTVWSHQQIGGSLSDTTFRTIFGLSPKRLYLGGVDVLASWVDETVWPAFTAEGRSVVAFWGRAPDEVWAVGGPYVFRWDGTTWQTAWTDPSLATPPDVRSFQDLAPCGALGTCVASSGGNVLRHHPAQPEPWRRIALAFDGYYRAVVSVGSVGAGGALWMISNAAVLRERGWGVEVMPTAELGLANGIRELRHAHASAAGALWVVGDQNLLARYDAPQRRFVVEAGPAAATTNLRSVRATTDGMLIVGAADSTLYWREAGQKWRSMLVDAVPRALWDDGAGTVYWASAKGLSKCQLQGGTAAREQTGDFEAIDGYGSDLWAVGTGGKVWRRSTGGWAQVDAPSLGTINLHAVYVPPSGGVWIAGDAGKLWRTDAARKTLELMATGTVRQLRSLHGSGADDVWIGGDDVLLHYPDGP